MTALLRTPNCFAMLFVRVALGASLLSHGLEKMGLFEDGGPGMFEFMGNKAKELAGAVGVDPWLGWCALAAEVLGSVALILGVFGRFCALCIGALMVVAAWKAGGLEAGHYMDWWRGIAGSYHILAVGASLAILIRGSGALSIDHALAPKPKIL